MSDDDYLAVGITRGATVLSLDAGSVTVADHPGGVRLTVRTGYAFSSVVLSPHQRDVLRSMLERPATTSPVCGPCLHDRHDLCFAPHDVDIACSCDHEDGAR